MSGSASRGPPARCGRGGSTRSSRKCAVLGERFAAQHHEPRWANRLEDDFEAGFEDNQLILPEPLLLSSDFDRSTDDEDGPLDVLTVEAEARAGRQGHVGIEHVGEHSCRRALAMKRACDQAHVDAFLLDARQRIRRNMLEARVRFLVHGRFLFELRVFECVLWLCRKDTLSLRKGL